ncbi:MAG: CBS domain-containing protein [Acidobacteriota bacterium]
MPETSIEGILRTESIGSMSLPTVSSRPSTTELRDIIGIMKERPMAAVVITEGDKVVGIFTERDVLNRIVGLALNDNLPIEQVMTKDPLTLTPADRLADAIRLMTDRGYRHIPLVDDGGRYVGMISARDIIGFIAEHYPQEVFNLPHELDRVPRHPEGG